MHKLVIVLSVLFQFAGAAQAAHLSAISEFEHISVEHGLSQITVYAIYQDRDGFIWFGTQDGLNRYDGYDLKVYRHRPFDRNSLSHNWIYSIAEDLEGNLLIGTRNGLNLYRQEQDTFELFVQEEVLLHQDVQNIHRDFNGNVWFNSSAGVYNYIISDSTLQIFRWEHDISGDELNHFFLDRENNLWAGTNAGLHLYDRAANKFIRFRLPEGSGEPAINDIAQDRSGLLWLATAQGIYCFDPGVQQYRSDLPAILPRLNVNVLLTDNEDQIWLGTNNGVYLFDRTANSVDLFTHEAGRPSSLSYDVVFSLYQDRSGMIWIGTYGGGVNKLNLQKKVFTNIRGRKDGSNGLQGDFVYACFEDADGKVLIGTDNGLDKLDVASGVITPFAAQGYPGLRLIRSILRDRSGLLWAGTAGNGLFVIDDRYKGGIKIKNLTYRPEIKNSIGSNFIMRLVEDENGTIWIGTTGGLCRLTPENRSSFKFDIFRQAADGRQGLPVNHVRALCEGCDSLIWIGTYGGGLASYNRSSGEFRHFRHDPADVNSISSNYIYAVLADRSGAVWIGTYGGGLNRFMPTESADQFEHFYMDDGLPGNLVYGILEDEQGFIWVSTNNGLARLKYMSGPDRTGRGSLAIRSYDVSDGIQNNEFNFGAYYKTGSGQLFFGGVSGLTYFDPTGIRDRTFTPPVVLTDFRIFNRSVKAAGTSVLPVNITRADRVELLYRQNVFTFEFAALDYTAPVKNKYAYKMDGFDPDWTVTTSRDRSATYTNLDPGEYQFRLIGSNSDGVWSPAEKRVTVTVIPPFWLTWWFKLAWITALFGGFFLIYGLRVRNTRKQTALLEKRIDERTSELRAKTHQLEITNEELESFAYSVSHDLRSPLRAISGYSSMILEDHAGEITNKEIKDYLFRIRKGSHQMSNLIDSVLRLSRLTRGSLNPARVNLTAIAGNVIRGLQEADPGRSVGISIDQNLMGWGDHALLRTMLENLLGNAWKFTAKKPAARIQFGCQTGENGDSEEGVFFVRDNGAGFDMRYSERLFQPFQRLHSDAEFPGTGIGLATVKRIINRHGGRIWAESAPDQQTTFYFTLPAGQLDPA